MPREGVEVKNVYPIDGKAKLVDPESAAVFQV